MPRLIDADALVDALMTYTWCDEDEWVIDDADEKRVYIEQWLPNIPTVELPKGQELIRCKDCKRRLECDYCIENGDDWFCADGEAKEDDA